MDAREVDVFHAPEWRRGGKGEGEMRVLRRFILWGKIEFVANVYAGLCIVSPALFCNDEWN